MTPDQFSILIEKIDAQTDKLDELHGDFREFKGKTNAEVEALRVSTKLKFEEMEKQADKDRFWHRTYSGAIIPLVGIIHHIAAKYGLIN